MKEIKIGLHYEGINDERALKGIILKIVDYINPSLSSSLVFFRKHMAKTALTKESICIASELFFGRSPCDIGVFFTDSDGDNEKYKKIKKIAAKNSQEVKAKSIVIVGCPHPVFEQWFLKESDAIKKVLGLPGDKSIPHNKIKDPKNRCVCIIKEAIKKNPTIGSEKTIKGLYADISNNINVKKLLTDRSFKRFFKEIHDALNRLGRIKN